MPANEPTANPPQTEPPPHERVLDLGNGLAVYRVTLLKLREQRKNARVMPPYQMEVLTSTLKRYQRLESLPLCCFEVTKGGNRELCIIDGHHRVRASLHAGLVTAFALVIEEDLTREQIVSRQLAHNAITGYDEEAVLADLLSEITDKQLRYDTGLELAGLKEKAPLDGIKPAELIPAEVVVLFFAPEDRAKWKQALELLAAKAKDAKEVEVANLGDFEEFSRLIRNVCHVQDVKNVTRAINILSKAVVGQLSGGNNETQ